MSNKIKSCGFCNSSKATLMISSTQVCCVICYSKYKNNKIKLKEFKEEYYIRKYVRRCKTCNVIYDTYMKMSAKCNDCKLEVYNKK